MLILTSSHHPLCFMSDLHHSALNLFHWFTTNIECALALDIQHTSLHHHKGWSLSCHYSFPTSHRNVLKEDRIFAKTMSVSTFSCLIIPEKNTRENELHKKNIFSEPVAEIITMVSSGRRGIRSKLVIHYLFFPAEYNQNNWPIF